MLKTKQNNKRKPKPNHRGWFDSTQFHVSTEFYPKEQTRAWSNEQSSSISHPQQLSLSLVSTGSYEHGGCILRECWEHWRQVCPRKDKQAWLPAWSSQEEKAKYLISMLRNRYTATPRCMHFWTLAFKKLHSKRHLKREVSGTWGLGLVPFQLFTAMCLQRSW